eukprot:SAG11_NODE_971_length_6351_cov_4.531190_6_plen_73_part_00
MLLAVANLANLIGFMRSLPELPTADAVGQELESSSWKVAEQDLEDNWSTAEIAAWRLEQWESSQRPEGRGRN